MCTPFFVSNPSFLGRKASSPFSFFPLIVLVNLCFESLLFLASRLFVIPALVYSYEHRLNFHVIRFGLLPSPTPLFLSFSPYPIHKISGRFNVFSTLFLPFTPVSESGSFKFPPLNFERGRLITYSPFHRRGAHLVLILLRTFFFRLPGQALLTSRTWTL